ncbi:D-2-hydroxyacid dehydrogenase [Pseudoflavonifractor sp. MSJ-37]|uniref:D-2-hydroxyacid dehydrogenase n=1 Tax=Pseudoflavonifractor sp. MSJ-37 TaxID=2841531 RepID=UPI001C114CD6|nr:D-2-hydroxyacid dehydrogenase [Pseudoflavonifractor sp. MSJ-37]MBU5435992.1 D-2-hydroxyacid dehydrogenase [Pseudoflavonifractor sp. MSJ-37]
METILNLFRLTEEEQAAFQAAAAGHEILFRPVARMQQKTSPASAADYAAATVILGCPPVADLAGAPHLKWLQTWSAGVDAYLAPGVLPEGAMLTSAVGGYGPSVSEHLLAMLLALWKKLPQYRDAQNDCRWTDFGEVKSPAGSTVLIAGTGDLGSSFAKLMKALGTHTIGLRRDAARAAEGIDEMYALDQLDGLLPQADVVVLTLPRSPETDGLIDEARLRRMKADAVLLNGGRGTAVDCAALARVLRSGHLWGAGLDVTDPEPLPAYHPLWREERCLITPHVAGGEHLPATRGRLAQIALDQLRRYLAGEPLKNRMK